MCKETSVSKRARATVEVGPRSPLGGMSKEAPPEEEREGLKEKLKPDSRRATEQVRKWTGKGVPRRGRKNHIKSQRGAERMMSSGSGSDMHFTALTHIKATAQPAYGQRQPQQLFSFHPNTMQ